MLKVQFFFVIVVIVVGAFCILALMRSWHLLKCLAGLAVGSVIH